MNKFVTIAAVAALTTLSACSKGDETINVPADETAAATTAAIELNDDGSVKTVETETAAAN